MKNYQPQALETNAYRIKETGDGFLCSIGCYIILQERVYQSLSDTHKEAFELMDLATLGIKVCDDAEATACCVQKLSESLQAFAS